MAEAPQSPGGSPGEGARVPPDAAPRDAEVDVRAQLCPMTWVRAKLALERVPVGGTLLVRLRGEEPRRNLPRSAALEGHEVLGLEATGAPGEWALRLRRGARRR